MKMNFVGKLAVAALLALGSISQAQEEATSIPAVEALTPQAIDLEDGQQSVGDNDVVVEGEVAPVAPVPDSLDMANASGGSTCLGCGQASGSVGCGQTSPDLSAPAQLVESLVELDCWEGCSQCASGCGQISQVAFEQPVYQSPDTLVPGPTSIVTGAIVNTDPLPATQISTSCQVTSRQASSTADCNTCSTCQPTRVRLFRGRIFRNR